MVIDFVYQRRKMRVNKDNCVPAVNNKKSVFKKKDREPNL